MMYWNERWGLSIGDYLGLLSKPDVKGILIEPCRSIYKKVVVSERMLESISELTADRACLKGQKATFQKCEVNE